MRWWCKVVFGVTLKTNHPRNIGVSCLELEHRIDTFPLYNLRPSALLTRRYQLGHFLSSKSIQSNSSAIDTIGGLDGAGRGGSTAFGLHTIFSHKCWSVRTTTRYISHVCAFKHLILTLMAQSPSCIWDCGLWRSFIARRPCPSEGVCGLYGLRLMHRLNIFLSCSGHSGWAGFFFVFNFF